MEDRVLYPRLRIALDGIHGGDPGMIGTLRDRIHREDREFYQLMETLGI